MNDDLDLSLEEAKELMDDAKPVDLAHCETCAAPYENPFRGPLRFLWWLDDKLHRRHTVNWFQRKLCDLVDRMLLSSMPE